MKTPQFLKTKRNRLVFFGSILVFCVSATIYFSLQEGTYAEQFLNRFFQPEVSQFLLKAIPAILALIAGVTNEIFSGDLRDCVRGKNKEENSPNNLAERIEPDLRKLYGLIKRRFKQRYEDKLDERFEITLEVNDDWRFYRPATYKFSAEAKVSEAVTAVRRLFDEKGRLLIVGNPGSGKTVLLLNLALQLLGDEYRIDRRIPVIFNLASWREDHQTFEEWLIDMLKGYGLSKDFAKTVLREKKIIFLLDGLDELARNEERQTANAIRAKCMESLNDYLREGRQTVICCRRKELAQMQITTVQDAPVSARVEVLDLTEADIILALQKAQSHNESRAAAENLEKMIGHDETDLDKTLLEVLSTPFYFTTALEVFDKPILNDTVLPKDSSKLENYLLKSYIDNKLKYTPKLTDFEKNPNRLKHWLIWLAQSMEKKQRISLELADLQPTDLKKKWHYTLVFGLVAGLAIGMVMGMYAGLVLGMVYGVVIGLINSFVFGLISSFHFPGAYGIVTQDNLTFDFSLKSLKRRSVVVLFFFVLPGLVSGGVAFGMGRGFTSALVFALPFGLILGSYFLLLIFLKGTKPIVSIESAYQRISSGLGINFVGTLGLMIVIVLSAYLINATYNSWANDEDEGPRSILSIFYMVVVLPITLLTRIPIFQHSLLRFCLWFEGSMPLKYATFLDLAEKARILEKEGGQWRFRHQNLQEYFANLDEDE